MVSITNPAAPEETDDMTPGERAVARIAHAVRSFVAEHDGTGEDLVTGKDRVIMGVDLPVDGVPTRVSIEINVTP